MEVFSRAERVKVFVPDIALVWISADIIEEGKRGHYEIEIDDVDYDRSKPKRRSITTSTLCRNIDSLPLQNKNMSSSGVEDMCTLDYLHEPSILDNLRRRHTSFLPYTYTGDICIAVRRSARCCLLHFTVFSKTFPCYLFTFHSLNFFPSILDQSIQVVKHLHDRIKVRKKLLWFADVIFS